MLAMEMAFGDTPRRVRSCAACIAQGCPLEARGRRLRADAFAELFRAGEVPRRAGDRPRPDIVGKILRNFPCKSPLWCDSLRLGGKKKKGIPQSTSVRYASQGTLMATPENEVAQQPKAEKIEGETPSSEEDLTGDGGVIKKIIKEGSGWDRPKGGAEVRPISYSDSRLHNNLGDGPLRRYPSRRHAVR